MPQPSSTAVYFVDVYTPNEGEPELSLEFGILRWFAEQDERPEVYVSTYLRPEIAVNRVRWPNAQSEMKIDRDRIEGDPNLPTLNNMIAEDYLEKKHVVCFDACIEPFPNFTVNAYDVVSIVALWNDIYSDDEKALKCTTLDEMCDYIGIVQDNNENTKYTPLLKRLNKMAALWSLLSEIEKNPKARRNLTSGGIQFNLVWPLPKSEDKWFEKEPEKLSDLTNKEIEDFFTGHLADRIDWYSMNMYASDWIYHRAKRSGASDLTGKRELAEFVFSKVFTCRMQIWVLIFYALYHHKKETSLNIALSRGDFRQVEDESAVESFVSFIVDNLDVFLSAPQKNSLIASLVKQTLEENDSIPFEHYNYDKIKKNYKQTSTGPRPFYTKNAPTVDSESCYKEIRNAKGKTIYRCYEVKSRGKNRQLEAELVVRNLTKLYSEALNVFSDIWLTTDLKLWIQFITGHDFTDLSRESKETDPHDLIEARLALKKIIENVAYKYMLALHNHLEDAIRAVKINDIALSPICFNFQGISVEVIIKQPKVGLLGRLLSFN